MAAAVAATVRDPRTPGTRHRPGPAGLIPASPRRYRDLHTFELQAPTRLIEWARGDRECEAGMLRGGEAAGWGLAAWGGCAQPEERRRPGEGEGGKEACEFGPVWGLGGEARVQGQDPKSGAKWPKLFRVQAGLELRVWGSMDCAVTRVCLREGGLGRGAALTLFLPLHAHPTKVSV